MKTCVISLTAVGLLLGGCTTNRDSDPQPIPGSITYGGQPKTRLTKAPVGGYVYNDFRDSTGYRVHETYIIQPDRSLRLMRREIIPDFPT
ncbi:hypothetical protein [Oryzifoliimicrobium ureilyticus]|uniref:hypothetical protein n=1 Tax=Oryzifoliimicrobium ureilyticus TaxID=3113724 RepID=UPI0030764243